ncbi:MAG: ComEC/Rec2 family competence protein [Planctomycetota bacterium]
MTRRPALAVFAALLAGVALSPWAAQAWWLAGLGLFGALKTRSTVGRDAWLLTSVLLLGAGHASTPQVALPEGPLSVRGQVGSDANVFPGGSERELRVGRAVLRVVFPSQLDPPAGEVDLVLTGGSRPRVQAIRREARGPGLLESWRAGVACTLAGQGSGRGLLRAVLLGDRTGLDPELRRAFRNTGCAHLLSISGLHVGVILVWALALGRRSDGRRGWVFAALVVYVALVGARPPILRAAVAGAVCVAWPGRGDPLNRLSAAGGLVLIVDPGALRTLGFFLSFGTVAGLILFAPRPRGAWGVVRGLVGAFAVSSTTLAVGLGHVPWINLLLAAPCVGLLSVILPLGFLGCAAALLLPEAWAPTCLAPADALAQALVALVRAAGQTGAWSWIPAPERASAALGLGLLLLAGVRRRDRARWRALAVAGTLALLLSFAPAPRAELVLRLDPRRSSGCLVADGRLWTWGSPAPRRVRRWREELGRPWSWTRLGAGAVSVETALGRVVVSQDGSAPGTGPVALLVIPRRLSKAALRRLLERTRPARVWAPSSAMGELDAVPHVTHFPPRGEGTLSVRGP